MPLAKPLPYLGAAQQLAASHSPLAIRLSNSAATVTSRLNWKGVSPTASARRPVAALLPSRGVAPPESMSDGACFSNSPFLQRSPDLRNGPVVAGFAHCLLYTSDAADD